MGYTNNLIAWYDLSTINSPNLSPIRAGQYDGTGVNLVAADIVDGIAGGKALRLDGNNKYVNIGDVLELNVASVFTIAFWMNQDIVDSADRIFFKSLDATHRIVIVTGVTGAGTFLVVLRDGADSNGRFEHGAVISDAEWHHFAVVFDGSGAANADRLKIYLDAVPQTLAFIGTIPAVTPDLAGVDARFGSDASSFDGILDEYVILNTPLTQIQVNDLMIRQRRGML